MADMYIHLYRAKNGSRAARYNSSVASHEESLHQSRAWGREPRQFAVDCELQTSANPPRAATRIPPRALALRLWLQYICVDAYVNTPPHTLSLTHTHIHTHSLSLMHTHTRSLSHTQRVQICQEPPHMFLHEPSRRGGGLGSRPKKMYGERLGDGVEYHLIRPTPRR